MSEKKQPIPLREAINEKMEKLIEDHPTEERAIRSHAVSIAMTINGILKGKQGKEAKSCLNNVCRELDLLESNAAKGLIPEIKKEMDTFRTLIRIKITTDEIELGPVSIAARIAPNPPRIIELGPGSAYTQKAPGSLSEELLRTGGEK